MREHNIQPTQSTYNLLARCIRDSGIGEPSKFAQDLALASKNVSHNNPECNAINAAEVTSTFFLQKEDAVSMSDLNFLSFDSKNGRKEFTNENSIFEQEPMILLSPLSSERLAEEKSSQFKSLEYTSSSVQQKQENESHNAAKVESIAEKDPVFPTSANTSSNLTSDLSLKILDEAENSLLRSSIKVKESSHLVKLSDLEHPSGRLTLLGGMELFVFQMAKESITPDIKTFTLLLSALPTDIGSEAKLIELMEKFSISPEIDFFNDIMMRRNVRGESHMLKVRLKVVERDFLK